MENPGPRVHSWFLLVPVGALAKTEMFGVGAHIRHKRCVGKQ